MTKGKILVLLSIIIISSCNFFEKEPSADISKEWEMTEIFMDETPELLEGGYCSYYYNYDNPIKDTGLYEEENDHSIVAIVIEPTINENKTKAKIWVDDNKIELKLTKDETISKNKYIRTFENDQFKVTLDMKINERIDGMDDEDMIIYSGKMKVLYLEDNSSKEFKIKGGC